jgi:hypothetical protein
MRIRFLALFLFMAAGYSSHAQTTNYQVYALYVFNIAKYSSWPDLKGEIHITVLGKSKAFDELLKQNGKVVNGNTIKVDQVEAASAITTAQIVYVSDGKSSALDELLKVTEGKSVLIVTEREGLHKKGAGFSFVVVDKNLLRFDINLTDVEKRSIKISKNLSTLANSQI